MGMIASGRCNPFPVAASPYKKFQSCASVPRRKYRPSQQHPLGPDDYVVPEPQLWPFADIQHLGHQAQEMAAPLLR